MVIPVAIATELVHRHAVKIDQSTLDRRLGAEQIRPRSLSWFADESGLPEPVESKGIELTLGYRWHRPEANHRERLV